MSLRRRFLRKARQRVEARARQRVEAQPELAARLRAYLARTDSTGASWSDYEVLYRRVRSTRPREILECGTGVSTLVLAQALAENAREGAPAGRVTSMEEESRWHDMACECMPTDLRPYVDLRLSPIEETGYWVFRGTCYREVPQRPYDLVFVDGPRAVASADGSEICSLDLVRAAEKADRPVSGIVDERLFTSYVMQQIFGARFRFDAVRKLGFLAPCTAADLPAGRAELVAALKRHHRVLGPTRLRL